MNFKIKGHVKLIVRDAKTGTIIPKDCQDTDNMIMNNYTYLVGEAMKSPTYINVTHCSVGVSNVPVTKDQGELSIPINPRQPISDIVRTSAEITFSTYFSELSNNGTWRESGLFTSLTAGTMVCRALFNTPFEKIPEKTVNVEWTIRVYN